MKAIYKTEVYTKKRKRLTEHAKQKVYGIVLFAVGVALCAIFKEDATAGFITMLLGAARIAAD